MTTSRPAIRTTHLQKALLAVFGLGLFLLLLTLAEGLLRVFDLGDPRAQNDPFVGFAAGRDLFTLEERPDGDVYMTHPEKLAFFNHQEFPREKAIGTYRVFALGGSTTAGRPYDADVAFPRWLELYLRDVDPSRTYEVINAGAISYASYRIVLLMRELVRYEPDLFILYTGHNEFLEERSYSNIIHQNPITKKLQFWLGGLHSFTLAKRALDGETQEQEILPAEVNAKLDGWTGLDLYHRDDDLQRSILEHFKYNLHQMVQIAERHGVRLITVVPASNIKDFSPFKSEHGPTVSESDQTRIRQLLDQGRRAFDRGLMNEARPLFEQALALDPAFAESQFRAGQLAFLESDFATASKLLVQAKERDVAPLRALEPIAEIVRQVMRKESGLPLIDLPRILGDAAEAREGHRLTGNDEFLDHVHPDLPIHSRIAVEILDILAQRGVVDLDPSWTSERQAAIYDRHLETLDPAYYAQRDLNLAKVLGWSGKLAEAEEPLLRALRTIDDHPEVHLNLGIVYQRSGRVSQALEALQKAQDLAPQMPEVHFNLGVVLGQLGQIDPAITALEHALRLRPEYPEAEYNLGILELERGSPESAIAALERSLDQRGETVEILARLGRAYRRVHRLEDAASMFLRGLSIDPNSVALRLELGITLADQGRFEEAKIRFDEARSRQPRNAEISYNLGLLASQRGDRTLAIENYQETLELDPSHVQALNNLGIQLAFQGDLSAAENYLAQAIARDPTYAEAHFNLGVVFDGSGRPEQAIDSISQAIELDPNNGRFHLALAAVQAARGRMGPARDALRRAETLGVAIPPSMRQQVLGSDTP